MFLVLVHFIFTTTPTNNPPPGFYDYEDHTIYDDETSPSLFSTISADYSTDDNSHDCSDVEQPPLQRNSNIFF